MGFILMIVAAFTLTIVNVSIQAITAIFFLILVALLATYTSTTPDKLTVNIHLPFLECSHDYHDLFCYFFMEILHKQTHKYLNQN